jgi:hypothetical protein
MAIRGMASSYHRCGPGVPWRPGQTALYRPNLHLRQVSLRTMATRDRPPRGGAAGCAGGDAILPSLDRDANRPLLPGPFWSVRTVGHANRPVGGLTMVRCGTRRALIGLDPVRSYYQTRTRSARRRGSGAGIAASHEPTGGEAGVRRRGSMWRTLSALHTDSRPRPVYVPSASVGRSSMPAVQPLSVLGFVSRWPMLGEH